MTPRACCVTLLLAVAVLASAEQASAAPPPSGFSQTTVVAGLTEPTAMAFAPDGRLFLAQQTGGLKIVKNGTLLATSFVNLPVDSAGERGLLGVTVDPNFSVNHYVYVYYTATTPTTHNRVSRLTANGDTAAPGSEVRLYDLPTLGATNHNGGAIHFGLDGKLYIGVGENAVSSRAQDLSNPFGKILRINSDGSIPSDNPFVNTPGAEPRIWAYGLRNPFTFAVEPGTGRMFINDVGQSAWEEVDVGAPGANYGWPITEGPTNDPRFVSPLYAYTHDDGCAITGGIFYRPAVQQFPASFTGDYFFSDLCAGWIHRLDAPAFNFDAFTTADPPSAPVAMQIAPDGTLWYATRGQGAATGALLRLAARSAVGPPGWYLRNNNSAGFADLQFTYGNVGDRVLACDWNGDRVDTPAVVRNGVWYLRNSNSSGFANVTFGYGNSNDTPVCGDWNGDGIDTPGVVRNGVWYLRNSNTSGNADVTFGFGDIGDRVITGDWNGDGIDTPGVFRGGHFFERDTNTTGPATRDFFFGNGGDSPLAGDWNGDGVDTVGLRRNSGFLLRNSNTTGEANIAYAYGDAADLPVMGDWNGDGTVTGGVVRMT